VSLMLQNVRDEKVCDDEQDVQHGNKKEKG